MFLFLRFMWAALVSYKQARKTGTSLVVFCVNGVPEIACFVGLGREAWRISVRAIEEHQ